MKKDAVTEDAVILMDPDGAPLTASDLALLDGHPRLARLVARRMAMERSRMTTEAQKRRETWGWALSLLPVPNFYPLWKHHTFSRKD